MQCTNYSTEPLKTIHNAYGEAAADYIASIMETDAFKEWYGKEGLPKLEGTYITNVSGEKWDVTDTVQGWKDVHAKAAGYYGQLHDVNTPGIFNTLNRKVIEYNKTPFPLKAQIVRTTEDGKEYYKIILTSNKAFKKSDGRVGLDSDRSQLEGVKPLFYMSNPITEEELKGNDRIAVREQEMKEGVYQIGEGYYRVTLRNAQPVYNRNSGVTNIEMRKRLLEDGNMSFRFKEDFLANKLPMYLYDIKKVEDSNVKLLPDFSGTMTVGKKAKYKGERFLSGYADIDNFINTLVEHRTALYDQRKAAKGDLLKVQQLSSRISVISEQINNLKKSPVVDTINFVGRNLMLQLSRKLEETNTSEDIHEALRLTQAWANIGQVLNLNPTNPSEEDLKNIEDANAVKGMASNLFEQYFKKYRQTLFDLIDSKLPARNGVKASKTIYGDNDQIALTDINSIGANLISGAFSSNAIEQVSDALYKESDALTLDDNYDTERAMKEAVSELLGKDMHESKASDFNFLFTKKGELVTKYDREFQKKLAMMQYVAFDKGKMSKSKSEHYQNAIALGAKEEEFPKALSKKEYYDFEHEHFDYKLANEATGHDGQKLFDEFMEEYKQSITHLNEVGEEVYDQKLYDKMYKDYDPAQFPKYLDSQKGKDYNKGHVWYTKVIKEGKVALSSEYSALSEKQLAFYNYFTHAFREGQREFVMDSRYNELDLDKQLLHFVIEAGGDLKAKVAHMGEKFKDFVKDIATVRYVENDQIEKPTRALTNIEHLAVTFKGIDKFIPEANSRTAAHPLHILDSFLKASNMFKNKRRIEDNINMIRDLTMTAKRKETTGGGAVKRDLVGRAMQSDTKTHIADRVDFTARAELTGVSKLPYESSNAVKPGTRQFSAERLADSVNNFTNFRTMALAPLGAAGNLIMGTLNNYTYSAGGLYFNDSELSKAYSIMKMAPLKYYSHGKLADKNALKIAELMRRYNLIGHNMAHQEDGMAWFYTLQESGEFMSQGATAVAQMLHTKVETKEGTKTLWDLFSLDDKGMIVYHSDKLAEDSEWLSKEKLNAAFQKIRKVNQKIHGDYTNPLMVKQNVLGRVVMKFRTWLPMAMKDRFGAYYEDRELGAQKGRYRSAYQLGKAAMQGIFAHDWTNAQEMGKVAAKIFLPFIGRNIKLSEKLSDIDRQNLVMFCREMQFAMITTMAMLITKGLIHKGTGDDDAEQSMLRYLYNQMERSQSEMMFFFYPSDQMQILRDVVPLYSSVKEGMLVLSRSASYIRDPSSDLYMTGYRKGHSKLGTAVENFLPVTRSGQKMWGAAAQVFNNTQYR